MSAVGSEEGRGRRGGLRALGSTVLPARSVRGLAGVLLAGAVAMPWLAGWQGVVARPRGEAVVEGAGEVEVLRPELVRVPGGVFVMGAPAGEEGSQVDERPQHEAEVGSLEVCRTEVTQGQWKAVMGTEPFAGSCEYGCGDEYPAHSVSWNDAVAYMNRLTERENALRGEGATRTACYEEREGSWTWANKECTGYRLPTETEWEYVARAGTTTAYGFGDDAKQLCTYGNGADQSAKVRYPDGNIVECDDGNELLAEVGRYRPNAWELYDVHGNVWEWVWDWEAEYSSAPTGKGYAGPNEGANRGLRGGSFISRPADLRFARRNHMTPTFVGGDVGFRCVRVLASPELSTPSTP